MSIITYLRSSSYGCHDMCPMKYYLEYNLGHKGPPNIKAEKGTIVHKVLEVLADVKLHGQNGRKRFDDEIAGRINLANYDIDKIVDKCYDYYSSHSVNTWKPLDRKHCRAWTYKALEYNKGEHDPRNSDIVKAEQAFDIEITKPWAMYDYELPDGERLKGFLSIKGTIDQVSRINKNTYQILDWKTGKRINWATGEEKDYAALTKDHQLMMYYYAATHIYPEIDNIQLVIYFINDGGPFTICFSKEDIPRIEDMLRRKFEAIKNTAAPALKKTWKCTKFCHFGRTSFEGTSVLPIIEKRYGQPSKIGEPMTKCEQVKFCLEHRSSELVIENMSAPGHHVDYYQKPGDVEK